MYKDNRFVLKGFVPAGDQPKAILEISQALDIDPITKKKITLLGATGTGKTFTVANIIQKVQKPTLVIAHNKTLAAQLAQEFREFFPDAAVHYFVSYYDYYQPEAYMPITDTYIEKDAQINEEIDRLRHASTQSLLTRKDVIICASVSCIYGLGSPEQYEKENKILKVGTKYDKLSLIKDFVSIHYERTNADLSPGTFRAIGNRVDIMSVGETQMLQIYIENNIIKEMILTDPVSMLEIKRVEEYFIFPAKHFISNKAMVKKAITNIKKELESQIKVFQKDNKVIEEERIRRRTTYDIAMIKEIGYCNGIENYSRHLSDKNVGEPPDTLLSYFPKDINGNPDFLTIIDESHVTLPQLRAMYAGDQARKQTLVDYGFRLPSAKDNRPLKYNEFEERVDDLIYVSATPGPIERTNSDKIVEQIIRPTGLLDPVLVIKSIRENKETNYQGQIYDFIDEATKEIKRGYRVLATTLTKKMAENLSDFLKEKGLKAEYLHSDVKTIERIEILTKLRRGDIDCLVGVNLLREGLDLPEVSLIGILDADKEGFLRSDTSLIQTIGRAARNANGRVILYADNITGSMQRAIEETKRRREIQELYNKKHNITPRTIQKNIKDITESLKKDKDKTLRQELEIDNKLFKGDKKKLIKLKERQMNEAVKVLDFETAAILRDEIKFLKE